MVQSTKFIYGEMLPIRDFADWAEAWVVHGAVLAANQPNKVKDHLPISCYLHQLKEASQVLIGWKYDVAFRKHAAETPSLVWGEVMPILWMTTVLATA